MPHAETISAAGLRFCPTPTEALCRRLEHRAQARLFQIVEAEFERIHLHVARQFIHVHLAGEDIGR